MIVGRVAAHCPAVAAVAMRAVQKALRDVVVLRCISATAPLDKAAFIATASEAFGDDFDEVKPVLMLAYSKVVGPEPHRFPAPGSAAEASRSNTQMTAVRRSSPRLNTRRRGPGRSQPPREEARAWDREPMWLRVPQEPGGPGMGPQPR